MASMIGIATIMTFLFWIYACVDGTLTIRRNLVDDRNKRLLLCEDAHSSASFWKCTCYKSFNTIMSKQNDEWSCSSPFDVKCYHSLTKTKGTYLVRKDTDTQKVFPPIRHVDVSEFSVHVWTLLSNGNGGWIDITKEAKPFFNFISDSGTVTKMSIVNLQRQIWQGHVIKITFGGSKSFYDPCFTIKVIGSRDYPFNVVKFKAALRRHQPPTRIPRVTGPTLPMPRNMTTSTDTATQKSASKHMEKTKTTTKTVSRMGTSIVTTTTTTITITEVSEAV